MSQNLRHFTAIIAEDYHYSLSTLPPKKISTIAKFSPSPTIFSQPNIENRNKGYCF